VGLAELQYSRIGRGVPPDSPTILKDKCNV
jgi:hypothetical protein